MYFILFLLFSVANSSSASDSEGAYKTACSYLESVGNWMLHDEKSVEILCRDNNTNESDVAEIIMKQFEDFLQKIEEFSKFKMPHKIRIHYGRYSLRENDRNIRYALYILDNEWYNFEKEARQKIREYLEDIINNPRRNRLETALVRRMMRILPASNDRIKTYGFLELLKILSSGYKSIIVDPLYAQYKSSRVLIIHTIITLSNILHNDNITVPDSEKINFLFHELESLPFFTDDQKEKVDLKAGELLDVLDNVWKKLNGESEPPFTKVKVDENLELSENIKVWYHLIDSVDNLWKNSREGVHPPLEDIVKEHFGNKLKTSSPDIEWLRDIKKSGEREKKSREKGRLYYFLNSLLYPIIKTKVIPNINMMLIARKPKA